MSKVMVVGGQDSGTFIKWFGHRVNISGAEHVLTRAYFKDGAKREYYVKTGMRLVGMLDSVTVDRIEVCG